MATKKIMAAMILLICLVIPSSLAEFIVIENASIPNTTESITTNDSPNFEVIIYDLNQGFILSSNRKELNVCACSLLVDKITLQNTGNIAQAYTLTTDNEYSTLTQRTIVLNPGERKEIVNYINAPCKELSEEIKTIVTPVNGISKELVQDLNVNVCNNIQAAILNNTLTTTPCTPVKSNFTIKNPSDFSETYTFNTDLLKESISFAPNTIRLSPNESRLILFQYNTTCDKYGSYKGNIIINAENTGAEEILPINLNILKRYRYNVTVPLQAEACNFMTTRIPITIRNNEAFENTFRITIPKSLWFKLETEEISVGPNQQATIYVIAKPEWKDASEAYLAYTVTSTLGKEEKKGTIHIIVPNCNTFKLWKSYDDTVCSDERNYNFIIYNTGTKTNKFFVEVEGKGVLNNTFTREVTIASGQTQKIFVPLNIADKDQTLKFDVDVSLLNETFEDEFTAKVKVKSLKQCYMLKIEADNLKVNSTTQNHNITITNEGIRDGFYSVSLDSAPWATINRNNLFVKEASTETIVLRTNPAQNITGRYKATLTVTEENSNASYTKTFTIKANPKSFSQMIGEAYTKVSDFVKPHANAFKIALATILILIILALLTAIAYKARQEYLENARKLIVDPSRLKRKKR